MKQMIDSKTEKIHRILSAVFVAAVLIGLVWISVYRINIKLDFTTLYEYKTRLWQGFLMTVIISLASLITSLFIGLITALLQKI